MSTLNAHDPASHDANHGHEHSVLPYIYVFVALLALLAAAVGVAYIPTENYRLRALLTLTAYTIAVVKAVLIILWFMHVKESSRLTWLFASASFFWLLILIVLTLNDYDTRGKIPQARSEPPHTPYSGQAQEHRER